MEIIQYKRELIGKLFELAKGKREISKKTSQAAQERANEAEGPMQSRYSTFKEEGQYLAGGLKVLHEEFKSIEAIVQLMMKEPLNNSTRVELLSIVEIEFENEHATKFFVFPVLGGEKIDDITIITPEAPLCKAIMFKEIDYQFNLKIGKKIKKGEVINVQ